MRQAPKVSALRFAGYAPDEIYEKHRKALRRTLVYDGGYEPVYGRDMSTHAQARRNSARGYELGWHGGDPVRFLEEAKGLHHPAQCEQDDLPADLCAAVRFAVRKGDDIVRWRQAAVARIDAAAVELWPMSERMIAEAPEHVRMLASASRKLPGSDRTYNVALMACVLDATECPDFGFVRRMLRGFPQLGTQQPVGVYGTGGAAPEEEVRRVLNPHSNNEWNRKLQISVEERARQAEERDPAEAARTAEAVWRSTIEECELGFCVGQRGEDGKWRGLDLGEMGAHRLVNGAENLRALRRFGRPMRDGSTRAIDDGTENKLNSIFGGPDKLSLPPADAPARICRQYHREWRRQNREVQAFEYGLDDVKKAFRRIPVMWCGLSAVLVWDPVRRRAVGFLLPGFNFGTLSAVMAWNRVPAHLCHAARRLLAVPTVGYYDDFGVGGAACERGSGLWALGRLNQHYFGFAPKKHVPMTQGYTVTGSEVQPLAPLGVMHDFRSTPNTGHVLVGVTQERKDKVCALIDELLEIRRATKADCSTLFGKCRFVFSPVFGKVGLATLQPICHPVGTMSLADGTPGASALRLLRRLVVNTVPGEFPMAPSARRPVVVLTDAYFEQSSRRGGFGVVLWDPEQPQELLCAGEEELPGWMIAQLARLARKKTYIAQYELIAEICAYLTFPDKLRGRLVHHFVDNKAALAGSISGFSNKPDSAGLLQVLAVEIMGLCCYPWFGFVYSEDNISDGPSRGDFAALNALGALRRTLVRPTLASFASLVAE